VTGIWEVLGKRAFLDEVLAKARISRDVKFAGILQITDSFHRDVQWGDYLKHTSKLDIFFAYGRTWRQTHDEELQRLSQRAGSRIRVVLPDTSDAGTVAELARRFGYEEEYLVRCIEETQSYFINLKNRRVPPAQVEVWIIPVAPTFSFYRLDHIGVLALYTHRKQRTGVPTFVCEEGGTLYQYIRAEFAAMIRGDSPLARRVDCD